MLSVDVAVEPQDWEAVDTHVPRSYIHRRRRDDMVLHVMAQAGKPADQGTMHVKPVPTELGQCHVLSPSHQTYGGYHSTLVTLTDQRSELTIWRNASSGNAFSDVVRTLPSLPSIKVNRAATASSGAS